MKPEPQAQDLPPQAEASDFAALVALTLALAALFVWLPLLARWVG